MSFLIDEYNQAWSHYRHTESMRTQYLGFFFTVSLGSAAFAAPILRSGEHSQATAAVGTVLYLVALQAMNYFACASVVRMGSVLRHYHRAIDLLTGAIEEEGSIPAAVRGVMRTETRLKVSKSQSVSGLAERLMRGSMLIVNLLAWGTTIVWLSHSNDNVTSRGLASWALGAVCVVGSLVVSGFTIQAFRSHPPYELDGSTDGKAGAPASPRTGRSVAAKKGV